MNVNFLCLTTNPDKDLNLDEYKILAQLQG